MRRAFAVAVACALSVAACGGAESPGAQTPATDTKGGAEPEAAHTAGAPPSAPEVSGARNDLERAERDVAAAQSDCAAACRALSSMERAAEHLCALDGGSECTRARERVEAARERVRASCGGCQP